MDSKYSRRAFVIMPFSKTDTCSEAQWTETFADVFKPAVKTCGYKCERAMLSTGSLINTVIQDIVYSRIVIADITDRNANVFYELGVRHSVSKRTIMVTRNLDHVPSDLRGHWCLKYDTSPSAVKTFKKDISRLIQEIDRDPDRNDSPVSDFLDQEMTGIRQYAARDNIKRISALFTELSAILNTLNELSENAAYAPLIDYGCLDLLLNTLYVDVGTNTLSDLHLLRHHLKAIRFGVRVDPPSIAESIALVARSLDSIHAVRDQLSSGQFVEPSQISAIVWTPIPQDDAPASATSNQARVFSKPMSLDVRKAIEDAEKPVKK